MELKPGHKETDVGVIPEDWNVASLESVALPNGLVRGPFGGALKKEYFVRDGYKVYEQRNAIYASADIGTYFIDEDKHRELIRFDVKPGDFIVSCSGTIGCIYRIPQGAPKGVINQALLKISLDDQIIDPYYFLITFQSAAFQERIKENTHGGAMQNLVGMDIFRQAPLPLPTEPEQKAISTAIRDADALLDGLDRLIAKKRDLKQAAMQQLLTGKTRLPGFEGEWEVKRLGELATFHKGKGLPKSALNPYSTEPCIHYGELFTQYGESIIETISRTHRKPDEFRSVANDVLMPTSDVTPRGLAKASCVLIDGVVLGGDILVIRTNPSEVYGTFLSYVIRREEEQVLRLVTGTTVFHLYGTDMKKFTFKLPSLIEQQAIVNVLSDMDAEIAALEQRRNKTKDIKQAMMQELLTGKTRLVTSGESNV